MKATLGTVYNFTLFMLIVLKMRNSRQSLSANECYVKKEEMCGRRNSSAG